MFRGRVPSLEYPWSHGFDPQQDNPVRWRKEDQELSSAVLQVGGQLGLHETLFGVREKKSSGLSRVLPRAHGKALSDMTVSVHSAHPQDEGMSQWWLLWRRQAY